MKERDMFYQNVNQGYSNPGMFIPLNGYNVNTTYQAYGPNAIPNNYQNSNTNTYVNDNNYADRISKLERQVKNLDGRISKLENVNNEIDDNFYMI